MSLVYFRVLERRVPNPDAADAFLGSGEWSRKFGIRRNCRSPRDGDAVSPPTLRKTPSSSGDNFRAGFPSKVGCGNVAKISSNAGDRSGLATIRKVLLLTGSGDLP